MNLPSNIKVSDNKVKNNYNYLSRFGTAIMKQRSLIENCTYMHFSIDINLTKGVVMVIIKQMSNPQHRQTHAKTDALA